MMASVGMSRPPRTSPHKKTDAPLFVGASASVSVLVGEMFMPSVYSTSDFLSRTIFLPSKKTPFRHNRGEATEGVRGYLSFLSLLRADSKSLIFSFGTPRFLKSVIW